VNRENNGKGWLRRCGNPEMYVWVGAVWLAVGVVQWFFVPDSPTKVVFVALGAVFLTIGLARRRPRRRSAEDRA
jgi:membrane protein implicated in regulation of membrane protease activity